MQTFTDDTVTSSETPDEFVASAREKLDALRSAKAQLNQARSELDARIGKIDSQVKSLKSFLWSATGEAEYLVADEAEGESEHDEGEDGAHRKRRRSRLRGRPRQIADTAERILARRGDRAEVHLHELTREIIEEGDVWHTSKSVESAAAQVSAALNADSRFVRPRRQGHYGLSEAFPDVTHSVGERKKGRKSET